MCSIFFDTCINHIYGYIADKLNNIVNIREDQTALVAETNEGGATVTEALELGRQTDNIQGK